MSILSGVIPIALHIHSADSSQNETYNKYNRNDNTAFGGEFELLVANLSYIVVAHLMNC
jgi:hypothetical protein